MEDVVRGCDARHFLTEWIFSLQLRMGNDSAYQWQSHYTFLQFGLIQFGLQSSCTFKKIILNSNSAFWIIPCQNGAALSYFLLTKPFSAALEEAIVFSANIFFDQGAAVWKTDFRTHFLFSKQHIGTAAINPSTHILASADRFSGRWHLIFQIYPTFFL